MFKNWSHESTGRDEKSCIRENERFLLYAICKVFSKNQREKIEATSNQTQCPSRLNWLIRSITRIKYTINWRGTNHFHSENDNRPGCRNVSHCQQQSYSGLRSTGRSYSTYLWSALSFDRINFFNMAILLSMESLCNMLFTFPLAN